MKVIGVGESESVIGFFKFLGENFFRRERETFSQNYSQHIEIDSFLNADSESDISFEQNRSFRTKHRLTKVSKCTKTASRNEIA